MCEFKNSFKLCTCISKLDTSKPYWTLERCKKNLKDMEIVHIGMFPPDYHWNMIHILDSLNEGDPFDFDYKPKQRDTLTLEFIKDTFHLVYTNGKWRDFYEYISLDPTDLAHVNSGEIQNFSKKEAHSFE